MVFLGILGHAAGRNHLERLQGEAVHDHVLRRPVGPGDGVFILITLVLGGLHRARFGADLDLGHLVGHWHPQVDQVELGVAADDKQIAPRGRHARDMHGIAGLDDGDNLLRIAVDESHFAGIAQRHREQVVEIELVHLGGRPLVDGHQHLPGGLDVRHAELRRLCRFVQQIFCHQLDFFRLQFARGAPVGHAGRRAVSDEIAQILKAELLGDVGSERLARGALAQHPVTAGATLEINLIGVGVLIGGEHRRARLGARLLELFLAEHVEFRLIAPAGRRFVLLDVGRRGLFLGRERRRDGLAAASASAASMVEFQAYFVTFMTLSKICAWKLCKGGTTRGCDTLT